MSLPIWFNRPAVTGRELEYIRQAIEEGHVSGDGSFTKRCQARREQITRASVPFSRRRARTGNGHDQPLHLSTMGLPLAGHRRQCPVTEQVSDQRVRPPLYFSLTEDDQSYIIDAVNRFEAA